MLATMNTHTLPGSEYQVAQDMGVQALVVCFQVLVCLYIYTLSQPLHLQLATSPPCLQMPAFTIVQIRHKALLICIFP